MALVSSKKLLKDAQEGGYAVGAFNAENMEMVQAIVAAAEAKNSPVMIQTTPGTLKYADTRMFKAMAEAAAADAAVPVAMHLDHGDSFDTAMKAFRNGYTSIMIDGSHDSFEDNIAVSKAVADVCRPVGVNVEAELGKVGGKEDDLDGGEGAGLTVPSEAKEFVERTGIDALAVAIGTAHGFYKGEPHVDVKRLAEIREVVDIPLVLHGTSGVPDDTVRDCIQNGICKVNYATDLRVAFSNGVKRVMAENPDVFDPKKYGTAGRAEVQKYVEQKMDVVGSTGKAK
ncbi:MAG: class II fructose-1,6-bisphosphate aldolase [Eubacteriaceae bacterium]